MAKRIKQDISIGRNLKKYRLRTGLSQELVAAKLQAQDLDISREIISQMELGKYNIRVSVLLALVALYKTPVQDFFADLERYEIAEYPHAYRQKKAGAGQTRPPRRPPRQTHESIIRKQTMQFSCM